MANPPGIFDQTIIAQGWFDETIVPIGWFDGDFLDAGTVVAAEGYGVGTAATGGDGQGYALHYGYGVGTASTSGAGEGVAPASLAEGYGVATAVTGGTGQGYSLSYGSGVGISVTSGDGEGVGQESAPNVIAAGVKKKDLLGFYVEPRGFRGKRTTHSLSSWRSPSLASASASNCPQKSSRRCRTLFRCNPTSMSNSRALSSRISRLISTMTTTTY